jgi:hypothetical protein
MHVGGRRKSAEEGLSPISKSAPFDLEETEMRSRMTSISGKAIRTRGVEVTFGDTDSSGNE